MTDAKEDALESARAQLAEAIERFPLAVKLLRRSLFRQHVALNVTWATPMLDVVARAEGIDFGEAAWFITPPPGWPARRVTTDARVMHRGVSGPFDFAPGQMWRRHRQAGFIVRDFRRSSNVIGIRVLGDSVELTAIDGDLRLETYHGLGRILVNAPLPATLVIAACGRQVAAIVDHRWLADCDWPIIRVDEFDDRTALIFETGRAPWSAPWPLEWGTKPAEQL